jgi:hypothetical protein
MFLHVMNPGSPISLSSQNLGPQCYAVPEIGSARQIFAYNTPNIVEMKLSQSRIDTHTLTHTQSVTLTHTNSKT